MSNRQKYLRRLRSMTPLELVERSAENTRMATEWMRWRMGGHVMGEDALVRQLRHVYRSQDSLWATLLAGYCRDGPGPLYLSSQDRVARVDWLRRKHPDLIDTTLTRADRICNGEITLFGQTFELDFADAQVWMRDPRTGNVWPRKHRATINYRDGRSVGGSRWVWELNRHAHLLTLAKAFFLSNDERYAQEVRRQLISWIGANPPLTGINWTQVLEVSLRLMTWTWTMAFLCGARAFDADLFRALNRSIFQQIHFILQHLPEHTRANHRLIAEATALILCGVSFPWFHDSDRWIQTGRAILVREIKRQFYPDGVGAEQSLALQSFVMEMVLAAALSLQRAGLPLPAEETEHLERACHFMHALANVDGTLPDTGDRDESRAFPLDSNTGTIPLPTLLRLANAVLEDEELSRPGDPFDETLFWMTDQLTDEENEEPVDLGPTETSIAFPWGGYYLLRGPHQIEMTFDCGPLGYLSAAGHGHADALSITLTAYGQRLLIDPGTYAFYEAPAWRNFFRGTRAHNTVTVDGEDQSQAGGTFLWTRHAQATCHRWLTTKDYDYVEGSHDGYASLGIVHRRRIIYLHPDVWVITDDMEGKGDHHLAQTWHFTANAIVHTRPLPRAGLAREQDTGRPGDEPIRTADRRANSRSIAPEAIVRQGDVWLSLHPLAAKSVDARLVWGWLARIQGWVSPRYGQKEAAPVLSYNLRSSAPMRLTTVLQVGKGHTMPVFKRTADILKQARQILTEIEEN